MAKTKKRVFIIDDDPSHNDMLKKFLLDKFDVEVMSFTNGEDALRNINLNPSFVVLDYYLDRLNSGNVSGLDVLKQIRQMNPDAQIIMLSTQDKIEVAVDTMKYGAHDYVVKNPAGFLRIENMMNHINRTLHDKKTVKAYRTATLILGGIILILILLAVFLQQSGIIGESAAPM
jgi:two-component system, OmpR family, response regulator